MYQSVCPFVRIGSPRPLSRKRVCPSHGTIGRGGSNTSLGVRERGSQFGRLESKPGTLVYTLWLHVCDFYLFTVFSSVPDHDILVWIWIRIRIHGSCLWLMDLDPDPKTWGSGCRIRIQIRNTGFQFSPSPVWVILSYVLLTRLIKMCTVFALNIGRGVNPCLLGWLHFSHCHISGPLINILPARPASSACQLFI